MWPIKWIRVMVRDAEKQALSHRRFRSVLFEEGQCPYVSFCLVVLPQDKSPIQTLNANLKATAFDQNQTEFIVLIPAHDQISEWMSLALASKDRVRIFTYSPDTHINTLRNVAFRLASGNILFTFSSSDLLPLRATTYVLNEMTASRKERLVVFEKFWRRVNRFGIWRDTFYELGGFDEQVSFQHQCEHLVARAKRYGIPKQRTGEDSFVKTKGARRPFSLRLNRPKQIKVNTDFTKLLPLTPRL